MSHKLLEVSRVLKLSC